MAGASDPLDLKATQRRRDQLAENDAAPAPAADDAPSSIKFSKGERPSDAEKAASIAKRDALLKSREVGIKVGHV